VLALAMPLPGGRVFRARVGNLQYAYACLGILAGYIRCRRSRVLHDRGCIVFTGAAAEVAGAPVL
jgi:hypothetical protein